MYNTGTQIYQFGKNGKLNYIFDDKGNFSKTENADTDEENVFAYSDLQIVSENLLKNGSFEDVSTLNSSRAKHWSNEFEREINNDTIYGEYVYSYIDGIIKISEFLGINKECILLGLKNIKPLERRINVKKYKNGYFINDSYNINVNGVRESISLLKKFNGNNVVITGGITEQGKHFVSQNNKIKNILKNQNVIFIGDRNHPLVKDHNFLNLYITKTLSEAYTLVDKYQFDNILLLSKGEDIYLK